MFRSTTKATILLLCLCLRSWSLTAPVEPCLRAIIVADTISSDIRPGTKIDITRMKKSLSAIAHHIHYRPQIVEMSGKHLSKKGITKWIESLHSKPNDIAIFYFTGHGCHSPIAKQPFPLIGLPIAKPKQHLLALQSHIICKQIAAAKPRLGICLFDCCNNDASPKMFGEEKQHLLDIISTNQILPGLKTLFTKKRGMISIAASMPGQSAITAISGKHAGSYFTTGLIHSLIKEASKTDASWTNVCGGIQSFIRDVLHARQSPIYVIDLPPARAVVYPNKLKNRILDEEKASGFDRSETGQHCNMDLFPIVKSNRAFSSSKTDSSTCLGIHVY